jgi:hypothetical protein
VYGVADRANYIHKHGDLALALSVSTCFLAKPYDGTNIVRLFDMLP